VKQDAIDPVLCGNIAREFIDEYGRARKVFARNWTSPHEGYGVILEEVDEFWNEIKSNNLVDARHEAVQVGAMILRFIVECCDDTERTP